MITQDYVGLFRALLPEMSLVLGAFFVLGLDLLGDKNRPVVGRLRTSVSLGALAIVFASIHAVRGGGSGLVFPLRG